MLFHLIWLQSEKVAIFIDMKQGDARHLQCWPFCFLDPLRSYNFKWTFITLGALANATCSVCQKWDRIPKMVISSRFHRISTNEPFCFAIKMRCDSNDSNDFICCKIEIKNVTNCDSDFGGKRSMEKAVSLLQSSVQKTLSSHPKRRNSLSLNLKW